MRLKVEPLLRLEVNGTDVDMFMDANVDSRAKGDYTEAMG